MLVLGRSREAAEQLGFVGALTPTGAWCEDAWLATAMLVEVTERLKFLVAFRPGLLSPTLVGADGGDLPAALGGQVVPQRRARGGAAEQRAYGDFKDEAERYERAEEFLADRRRGLSAGRRWSLRGDASCEVGGPDFEPHVRPAVA